MLEMIDEEVTSPSLVPETLGHPAVTFSSHTSPYARKDRLTVPPPINGLLQPDVLSTPAEPMENTIMLPVSPRNSVPHSAASSTNPLLPVRKASLQFLTRWSPRERHLCCVITFMLLMLVGLLIALILIVSLLYPHSSVSSVYNQDSAHDRNQWIGIARKGLQNGSEETLSVCLSESCVKAAHDFLEAMDQKADPCQGNNSKGKVLLEC
ncbi:hypothetical protein RvY_14914-2 [Ramazzottius varieornatus]|uniref:Uncharacterized protein n=1 Tax=Ramazzottius varieornatus TaxID=947166 RepID=A0A1D1VWM2_RAMVA|nr:hypothetical protein RvY_14914-2 [Ramazzottius varieornatus]